MSLSDLLNQLVTIQCLDDTETVYCPEISKLRQAIGHGFSKPKPLHSILDQLRRHTGCQVFITGSTVSLLNNAAIGEAGRQPDDIDIVLVGAVSRDLLAESLKKAFAIKLTKKSSKRLSKKPTINIDGLTTDHLLQMGFPIAWTLMGVRHSEHGDSSRGQHWSASLVLNERACELGITCVPNLDSFVLYESLAHSRYLNVDNYLDFRKDSVNGYFCQWDRLAAVMTQKKWLFHDRLWDGVGLALRFARREAMGWTTISPAQRLLLAVDLDREHRKPYRFEGRIKRCIQNHFRANEPRSAFHIRQFINFLYGLRPQYKSLYERASGVTLGVSISQIMTSIEAVAMYQQLFSVIDPSNSTEKELWLSDLSLYAQLITFGDDNGRPRVSMADVDTLMAKRLMMRAIDHYPLIKSVLWSTQLAMDYNQALLTWVRHSVSDSDVLTELDLDLVARSKTQLSQIIAIIQLIQPTKPIQFIIQALLHRLRRPKERLAIGNEVLQYDRQMAKPLLETVFKLRRDSLSDPDCMALIQMYFSRIDLSSDSALKPAIARFLRLPSDTDVLDPIICAIQSHSMSLHALIRAQSWVTSTQFDAQVALAICRQPNRQTMVRLYCLLDVNRVSAGLKQRFCSLFHHDIVPAIQADDLEGNQKELVRLLLKYDVKRADIRRIFLLKQSPFVKLYLDLLEPGMADEALDYFVSCKHIPRDCYDPIKGYFDHNKPTQHQRLQVFLTTKLGVQSAPIQLKQMSVKPAISVKEWSRTVSKRKPTDLRLMLYGLIQNAKIKELRKMLRSAPLTTADGGSVFATNIIMPRIHRNLLMVACLTVNMRRSYDLENSLNCLKLLLGKATDDDLNTVDSGGNPLFCYLLGVEDRHIIELVSKRPIDWAKVNQTTQGNVFHSLAFINGPKEEPGLFFSMIITHIKSECSESVIADLVVASNSSRQPTIMLAIARDNAAYLNALLTNLGSVVFSNHSIDYLVGFAIEQDAVDCLGVFMNYSEPITYHALKSYMFHETEHTLSASDLAVYCGATRCLRLLDDKTTISYFDASKGYSTQLAVSALSPSDTKLAEKLDCRYFVLQHLTPNQLLARLPFNTNIAFIMLEQRDLVGLSLLEDKGITFESHAENGQRTVLIHPPETVDEKSIGTSE